MCGLCKIDFRFACNGRVCIVVLMSWLKQVVLVIIIHGPLLQHGHTRYTNIKSSENFREEPSVPSQEAYHLLQ